MTKRNESCPCGSGKKYKHCCSSRVPIDIDKLVEVNIVELQQDIYHFAETHYGESIEEYINDFIEDNFFNDDTEENFGRVGFLIMTWIILSLPVPGAENTILEEYIKKHNKKILRPALRDALQQLRVASPSICKVIRDDQTVLLVEDAFTREEKQIYLLPPSESDRDYENLEGSYVLGTTMNCHNRCYFFGGFQVIQNAAQIGEVMSLYDLHADELSVQQFMNDFFPEIIEIAFHGLLDFDEISWDTANQEQVIELVKANLNLTEEIQKPIEGLAITLWKLYCNKTGGNMKSIPNYAAALHYITSQFFAVFGEDALSKQQLANMYDIKVRALTETINKLEDVLEDDLTGIADELIFGFAEEDDDFTFDYDGDYDDLFELKDIDEDEFFIDELFGETPMVDELAKKRAEKQKVKK